MAAKVQISVVILTKNEAGRIRECLKSAAWAAECLVVDDESTDETVAIAQTLGARVLHRKMDIEGRHRNWAQAQAQHEWVLNLDADERVTPELAQEIETLMRHGAACDFYSIPRRNYIGRHWIRHGGWYPSPQLKLFKTSKFRWEEASVHPRAIGDGRQGVLEHDILHYSYRSISDFVLKMNRQTTLEAQKWIADKRAMPLGKVLRRTIDRFVRSYIGKAGWRDGVMGLVVAWFASAYQLLSYAKYLELEARQRAMPTAVGIAATTPAQKAPVHRAAGS